MVEASISSHQVILVLLFVALPIFAIVAAKSKNIRSFQFQIAIFIIIWIAGEMFGILHDMGIFQLYEGELGMQIHLISMIFFSVMIWLRYYFSTMRGKKIVDHPPDYF